jgi:integrase
MGRHLTLVRQPRKLPNVLNEEEVVRLLEHASGLEYRAALGVAYGAGLRVSEVANLKVSDIDSKRMLIRVEEGKHWIEAAARRLHYNKLAIALANKLARIAWGVLHGGGKFETLTESDHAPQPA